jgi:hypothetical protein
MHVSNTRIVNAVLLLNLLCFFFYKIREQESRPGSAWRWKVGTRARGKVLQIMYTQVSKCKNDNSRNYSKNQGRADERE